MLKKPSFPHLFKRLSRKNSGGGAIGVGGRGGGSGESGGGGSGDDVSGGRRQRRFRSFYSSGGGLRWKKKFSLQLWFVDGFLFKIVYVLEAMVLVLSLCLFYFCFGCNI